MRYADRLPFVCLLVCVCLPGLSGCGQGAAQRVDLSMGEEVLVFTEPVRDDGTIDYLAALNEKYSQGVTEENNAFRGLFLLSDETLKGGDWFNDSTHFAETKRLLGVTDRELAESPKLVGWRDYAAARGLDDDAADALYMEYWDGPYDDDAASLYVQWLKENEPLFQKAVAAIDKDAYWFPLVLGEWPGIEMLRMVTLPHLGDHRGLARSLQKWAFYSALNGEPEKVVRVVRAVRRLARFHAQEPVLISMQVGIGMDGLANTTVLELLNKQVLPEKTLAALDAAMRARAPRRGLAALIREAEKCMALDSYMQAVARRFEPGNMHGPWVFICSQLAEADIDVNRGLRRIAAHYDRLAEIASIGDFAKRQQAIDAFEQRFEEALIEHGADTKGADRAGSLEDQQEADQASQREKLLTTLFIDVMAPSLGSASKLEFDALAQERATLTAIATERYRQANGELPTALSDLVPAYLDAVPTDPFDNKPMRYQPTDTGFMVYSVGSNLVDDGGDDDRDTGDLVTEIGESNGV